ncbi:MAG: cupin domain-containing protein [Sphingobium sp.]
MSRDVRRIVTGLDTDGRARIILDASVPRDDTTATTVWHTPTVPADNSGTTDVSPPFGFDLMHNGGTVFLLVRMPAGSQGKTHATDTIDYITIVSGTVILELDGEEVALTPGMLCIDRGVLHSWRNDGPDEAVYTVVTIPALPVGAGSTV